MITILEAWTGPPGSTRDRKQAFRQGDIIQFNVVFVADSANPIEQVTVHMAMETYENIAVSQPSEDFEVISRSKFEAGTTFEVGQGPHWAFLTRTVPPTSYEFGLRDRVRAVQGLGGTIDRYVLNPGYRTFQAIVGVPRLGELDISTPWLYVIRTGGR